MPKSKGFTLIELLVAITIMAILASIGFTYFKGVRSKARDLERKGDLRNLSIALEGYYQKNGRYIKNVDDYSVPCTDPISDLLYNNSDIKNYLSNQIVPTDPKTDTGKYCYTSDGASFRLFARLENCDSDALPSCIQNDWNFSVVSPNLELTAAATPPTPTLTAPTVTTAAASDRTNTSATLNGSANPNGSSATGYFRYVGSNISPGSCNDTFGTRAPSTDGTALGSGTTDVPYSQPISDLTRNSCYYFCAIASNAGGTSFGSLAVFRTPCFGFVCSSPVCTL